MSRFGVFTISGTSYDLDDLTLDEVEQIEELAGGIALSDINFGSAKVMKAIAYTLMRRSQPELEFAEVGKVKVIDFAPADEEMPEGSPTMDGPENHNGSEPVDSGSPLSVESIPG